MANMQERIHCFKPQKASLDFLEDGYLMYKPDILVLRQIWG